ncbi:acetate/propionate family kinase [Tianweitania populi]|uniref:acetate/propionate family kinase n=1 Tax=Tianweitania populi TaxID=1607949 RepID=UPI0016735BA6|nr:acetate/propionate family kinase [Tianweitania populi]
MTRAVVSLNAGSSSIKFALFTLDETNRPTLSAGGQIEQIGLSPKLVARDADGTVLLRRDWENNTSLDHAALLKELFDWGVDHLGDREVIAIGHRVVHGGTRFAAPCLIDAEVLHALDDLCSLAPLHQPHNLAGIRAVNAIAPDLPQIACFDTAFHHDRAAVATRFAIPRALHEQGIRRYGFHGLSYEYIARRLREIDPAMAEGRVIVAHLGNGASLCGIREGRSVDTTMGFTALDGLMMGTRSGAIDPGVILHFQTALGMSAAEVEDLLYKRSGLLGVSGISSDMRALAASNAVEAEEAIELFAWRAAREAGGLMSSLEGLDGLVFTAGIGENNAGIRTRICQRLAWTGLVLDEAANIRGEAIISAPESAVTVRIIRTDEERMIALHTIRVLG